MKTEIVRLQRRLSSRAVIATVVDKEGRMHTRAFVVMSWFCLAVACGPGNRAGDDTGGGGLPDGQVVEGDNPTPNILILDFRSGWWAGSAGDFHRNVLGPMRAAADNITIEFHHLTIGQDIKCIYSPTNQGVCETVMMSETPTPVDVIARFDHHAWNDYNQVWILSGSEKDPSDVTVSGDLFGSFIGQGGESCNSLFIGAGDGFIDHGNAIAQSLGIGPILSTELAWPGFFFGTDTPVVDSQMTAGVEMNSHELFTGVQVIADGVGNGVQHAHGDSLVVNPMVQVIAHDSAGRPTIAVGSIPLSNGDSRPFVIDAGMQRYYGVNVEADTLTLLKNIRKYLAASGCRAVLL
jgi:hypothetical protein